MAVCILLLLLLPGAAVAQDEPEVIPPELPELGSSDVFLAQDWDTMQFEPLLATVRYAGEHCLVYVDDGADLSSFLVEELGTAFDTVVYPTLTAAYGSEPNPGLDGDPRVVILIYDFNDSTNGVDASFNPRDIDPHAGGDSNHREMFSINLMALRYDTDSGPALAAHEFAHLIVEYRDALLDQSGGNGPESSWLDEGFTTYAEHLCGYDSRVNNQLLSFTSDPDFSLARWQGVRANYGASYAFMSYLADREGPDFIKALVQQPLDGVSGIDATLAAAGSPDTFSSLFDDWVLAGFLNTRRPPMPPYLYSSLAVSAKTMGLTGLTPSLGTAGVTDYGAVYLDFPASASTAPFQAVLDGPAGAPLHAALVSWDPTGAIPPLITRLDLANEAVGDTVADLGGYNRHTLVVWARDGIGGSNSYSFTYSGVSDPPGGVQFLDLGGSADVYQYVAVLLARGIISGREIPAGSGLLFFMGKENVSRAQFAKMIMLATGRHTPDVDNALNPTFLDVRSWDSNGYPYDYVEEAVALGIVGGYGNGRFGPYDPITRSQLVLMITRGAAAAGRPLVYSGNEQLFADVPLSHPYYRQIMAAYFAHILSGNVGADGKKYFYPYAPASRNHVAKMTANLVALLETP